MRTLYKASSMHSKQGTKPSPKPNGRAKLPSLRERLKEQLKRNDELQKENDWLEGSVIDLILLNAGF